MVGDNTYKTGESVGEFDGATMFDEETNDYISIESISFTKIDGTLSITYKKINENPVTLTGPINAPWYNYSSTDPSTFTEPYIFFASYEFNTEDEKCVYTTVQWLCNPITETITPYSIILEIESM